MPWRDLLECCGDVRGMPIRFRRWVKPGVGQRVFEHLAQDAGTEYVMIDATIVRAHPPTSPRPWVAAKVG